MMRGLHRWMTWVFRSRLTPDASCVGCGRLGSKATMHHDPVYGWFCSEEELHYWWLTCQT
jgi:hypothetical protein